MRENGRSERLKSSADAPLCGRSMVEMLGVLAIIGVLSVGAMSGYSKAMLKYKLNRQAEQFSTIFNACIRYINDLRIIDDEVGGEYPLAPILIKLNEIPNEMIKNSSYYVYDIFDNQVYIYYHNTNYLGIITYINDNNMSLQICRNLITTAKENQAAINSVFFRNDYDDKDTEWSSYIYGDKTCTKSRVCLKDITLQQMDEACKFCASDRCLMYVTFK